MREGASPTPPFTLQQTAAYVLINVSDDLDIATSGQLEALLQTTTATTPARNVIVNLTDCRFMDSTGLRILHAFGRENPHLIVVVPAEHSLKRMREITQFDKFLVVVESLDAAVERASSRNEHDLP